MRVLCCANVPGAAAPARAIVTGVCAGDICRCRVAIWVGLLVATKSEGLGRSRRRNRAGGGVRMSLAKLMGGLDGWNARFSASRLDPCASRVNPARVG